MIDPSHLFKRDRWAAALAGASLLLGLFSYYWAGRHPEYPWDGPILLLAAMGLFLLALRRVDRVEPAWGEGRGWEWITLGQVPRWRLVVFAGSVALSLLLLGRLLAVDRPSYELEFLLWLAAIGAFTLAVAPPVSRPREDWGLWWEVHRPVVLALVAIFGVGLLLRLWDLQGIPSTLGGDEASQGIETIRVLRGELRNPFSTGWLNVPSMSFFFNSLSLAILGPTVTALRLPWAILGAVTILITFWLVTRLRNLTLGLLTAALLASYHYHIHFSRLGSNQIADPFFMALSLLFLYRARDRGSPLDWALAGITVGVAQYFYAGARLTIVVVGLCTLHFFWENRHRRKLLNDLFGGALTLLGAFLVTAGPMIQYALRFPNEYNARLNAVGLFQSGHFQQRMELEGLSAPAVLWDQFIRAFLAFNAYPDKTFWYGSPEPLMQGLWAMLFMLGLLYATFRLFAPGTDRRLFPLVIWWWSGMILGGMLTENPPSSQRLIVLAPPAVSFVALAMVRSLRFIEELWGQREVRELAPVLLLVTCLLGGMSVHWYFREFTPLNLYGSRNGEIATAIGYYLAEEMEEDQALFFLGPPSLYLGFASIPYLHPPAAEGVDLPYPLPETLTAESLELPAGRRPLFLAVPQRAEELERVEAAFPGGELFSVPDSKGEPLFWVYEP